MADSRPFRVVIGGGGISGLTFANALEKANIDYVLLEARETISPQVGASIGFFPNGGRIMDQLGCFDQIATKISEADNMSRFNYPTAFLEREAVLRILYDNLKDKSKIKVSKRISKVDHNSKEVIVLCEDGTAIGGDILVGCDGVHSKVRQELWRLSHLQEPLAIDPKDKEMLFAEYNCLFGISTDTRGVEDGAISVNYSEGLSTMIIGGKAKVFWFIFKRMDKVYKVPDIPRYTKEEAEVFAENIQDSTVMPQLQFRDIWKNRSSYTLVATEEAQLATWSWGRIACVGDCVHKMTPNMGAGGNAAIETAAALANELKRMVDSSEKGRPSFETIKGKQPYKLTIYQKIREKRVTAILKAANGLTRMHALKTWKDRLFAFWILPFAGDTFTNLNCDMVLGAVKLDYLPVPERSLHGTMPFNASQGLGQSESKLLRAFIALPFLFITMVASHFMLGIALPSMLTRIGDILEHGVANNIGTPGVVKPLQSLFGIDFLTDIGIVYAILLIESARRANIMTLASV
ncbi:FAD binding domain-containing protein [Setomelanomma holmii]|uniref:FAD binding domain-containing protein n=1 Tax=Setomelanomma holmii TaxID=210430 RepID=A0A9P4LG45_9PLEO|nr:FAD binding domain-containing protein [Setomelanomma holmii]